MEHEAALAQIVSGLREGTGLRVKVALDWGPRIVEAARLIADCLEGGGKVLLFGYGGSAADAQHLPRSLSVVLSWSGERFLQSR